MTLAPLGRAGAIKSQAIGPAGAGHLPLDTLGDVQLPAKLAQLLLEGGYGQPGRGLDACQDVASRKRVQLLVHNSAQERVERGEIRRVYQRIGICEQLIDGADYAGI